MLSTRKMNRSSPTNNSGQPNTSPPSDDDGTKLSVRSKRKSIATSSSEDKGEETGQAYKKIKSSNNNNKNDDDDNDYDSSSTRTTTIVVAAPPPPKNRAAGRTKSTKNNNNNNNNNNNKRQKVVTGYNLFIKEQLPIARAKSQYADLRNIVPMVAKKWNTLSLAKRQPYQDAAKRLTQRLRQQHVFQQQKKQYDAKCHGKGGREDIAILEEEVDSSSDDDESEEDEEDQEPCFVLAKPQPHGGRRARRPAAALKENDDTEDDDDDDAIFERNKSTTTTNKRGLRVPPLPPKGVDKKKKKKKKQPYYISAYNIFVQEQIPFAREDFEEGVHSQFVITQVAQAWREMSYDLRQHYTEQSRLWKEMDQYFEDTSSEESDEEEEDNDDDNMALVDQSFLERRRSARASPPTDMFGFSDHVQGRATAADFCLLGNITNTGGHGQRNRSRASRSNQNAHTQHRANNLKKPPPSSSTTNSPGAFSPYKIPAGYDDPLEEYFEDFILESANDDAFLLDAAADSLCMLQDTHQGPPRHRRAKSRNTTDNGNKHNRKKKIPAQKRRVGDTFGTHSSDSSDSSPVSQDSPESSADSSSSTNNESDDTNNENHTESRAYWKHPRGQVRQATATGRAPSAATSRFSRPVGRPPVGAVFCTRTGKYLFRTK